MILLGSIVLLYRFADSGLVLHRSRKLVDEKDSLRLFAAK